MSLSRRTHLVAKTLGHAMLAVNLHYLWIQSVDSADVIYVPTEAQLPILEAGRIGTRATP